MADIQSADLPLQLSEDSFTTTYNIVCKQQGSLKISYPVNTEESDCAVHTGTGAVGFSLSVSGVVKTDPTAPTGSPAVGEASYKKMQSWATGKTLLSFKLAHGTLSADFYNSGSVYLNDLEITSQTGQVVKFTATLTGTGVLDITP